jgi:hypothetical protein
MLTDLFHPSKHSLTQADRQIVKSNPGVKIHFPARLLDGQKNFGKLSIGEDNFTVYVSNYNQSNSPSLIHAISELSSEDLIRLKEKLEKAEKAKNYFSLYSDFSDLIEEIKLGSSNDIVRLEAELVKETKDLAHLNTMYKYELENLNNHIKELEKLRTSKNPIPQSWETLLIDALNAPVCTNNTKKTLEVLFEEHAQSVGITDFTCCTQLFENILKNKSHPRHALLVSKARDYRADRGLSNEKDKSLLRDHIAYLLGYGYYSDALLVYSGVIPSKVVTKESLTTKYNCDKKALETKISNIKHELLNKHTEIKDDTEQKMSKLTKKLIESQ